MQRNGQSATFRELIAVACCDNPTERRYFCFIKVLVFMSKMLSNSPMGIFNSKNFSGPPLKGEERVERGEKGRGKGRAASWLLGGWTP